MSRSRPLRTQIAVTAAIALFSVASLLVVFGELRIAWLSERFAREEARANAALVDSIRHAQAAALQRLNRDIATQTATTFALTDASAAEAEAAAGDIADLTEGLTPRPMTLLLSPEGDLRLAVRIDDDTASEITAQIVPLLGGERRFNLPVIHEGDTLSLVAVTEIRRGDRVIGFAASLADFGTRLATFFEDAAAVGLAVPDREAVLLGGEEALIQHRADACCIDASAVTSLRLGGRAFMVGQTPVRGIEDAPIATLLTLREVTEADARDRRLTTLIYMLACMTILLSIGLLMRAVRIALRPLGAVVRLLRRMSDGETAIALKPFRSAREIETLADTVETVRSGLDAQKSLVALTEQLEGARRIQQSLLPQSFDLAPATLDLFGAMRPAEDVGGDFFDTFRLDDGRIAVVVADVSGKGMGAALFAALASTALRSYARLLTDPVAIIEATNNELCERNREDLFITVLFAVIDPSDGRVEIVNAGHCPPFLATGHGEPGIVESVGDLVLGIMPGMAYERHILTLDPGDTLLIYSDGFDEAQNTDTALLGAEDARRIFAQSQKNHAKSTVDSILSAIDAFANGAAQADDITLFAVRRL